MKKKSKDRLLGALLCGGQSRRMRQDKALLRLPDGTTLLQNACEKLQAFCDKVEVVGDRPDATLADALPDAGPLSGVLAALEYGHQGGFGAILTLSVDTPMVDLRPLLAQTVRVPLWLRADVLGAPLVAKWPVGCRRELRRFLEQAKRSVLDFHREIASESIEVGEDKAWQLRNINTPEEWKEMLAIWPKISQEAKACEVDGSA